MRPYKETVVIINLNSYKETSKLVTFFGVERGRFTGIVQGASRLKGRWGGKLDLFAYGEVTFTGKKEADIVTVTEFIAEETFYPLRLNLDKLALASYFAEILNKVEGAEARPLFVLFLQALHYLVARENLALLRVYFEARLFRILGLFPSVGSCINCGNEVSSTKILFSPEAGGEFCLKCGVEQRTSIYNRANWLKLTTLASLELAALDDFELNKSELAEIRIFCQRYREFHLGVDFKTIAGHF